jgi:probable rRNA maturation factor
MFVIPEHALPPACVLKAHPDRRGLYAAIRSMAVTAGVPCPDLALLDDRGMEALQAACLGRAGPTNILSFPVPTRPVGPVESRRRKSGAASETVPTGPGGSVEGFRGCLALSVDTLEREVFLYGQDATAYCIRLLAHGLAHLAGHGHGPAMRELEERLEHAGTALPIAGR